MILFTSGLRLAEAMDIAESANDLEMKVYVFYKDSYTVDFPLLERFAARPASFEFIRSDDEGMFMFKLGEMNATLPQGTEIVTLFSEDFEIPTFLSERWKLKPYSKAKKPARKKPAEKNAPTPAARAEKGDTAGKKTAKADAAAAKPSSTRKKKESGAEEIKGESDSLYKDESGRAEFAKLLTISPEEIGFQGSREDLADTIAGFLKKTKGRNRNFQIKLLDSFGEEGGNKLFDAVSGKLGELRALITK